MLRRQCSKNILQNIQKHSIKGKVIQHTLNKIMFNI